MEETTSTARRTLLQAAAVATLAAAGTGRLRAQATADPARTILSAFTTPAVRQPLPFDPNSIDGLSEKLLMSHWQNNYGGSVDALNAVKERLAAALADDSVQPFVYNDLKREHLLRTNSITLHELYFANIGPTARDTELDAALTSAFGSVASWEREFVRIAAGLGGGPGWVMLGWNTHAGMLENYWMADHMHAPAATVPLLLMDMYEHSYAIDYGAAARDYINAFMRNINWTAVVTRLNDVPGA